MRAFVNYLYVTWLIEERAVSIYEQYSKLLDASDFKFNLNSVLKEEARHLKETRELLQKLEESIEEK